MLFPRSLPFQLAFNLLAVVLLTGCVPASSTFTPVPQPTAAPQVIIQGENPSKEEIQTIEIDNCNGKTDISRTETRSQSIETTISADLAAKLGASGAVIYGEVQATVGTALGRKVERATAFQISAPPGSRIVFQLAWTGPEQLGFVQNLRGSSLPVAFTVFTPTDVRIKNQNDIGCPTPIKPATGSIKTIVTSSKLDRWACIQEADSHKKTTWETCWRYVRIDGSGNTIEASKDDATAIEWVGPTDLTYTTIGQYHTESISEWYAWAAQRKEVRFCIDVGSKAEVEARVEEIAAGCYSWRRGPFMIRQAQR